MAIKKEGLERVGLRVPAPVKEWYMRESNGLGLTMGQYMTLVLVNYQRNQENAEMMKTLTEMSKDTELKIMNREMLELMKSPDFKQVVQQLQIEGAKEVTDNQKQRRQKP